MSSGYRINPERRGPAVTFIVGLAGSGKSTLLKSIYYDAVFEECFWFNKAALMKNHADVLLFLSLGMHCVITERRFMRRLARDAYTKCLRKEIPTLQINWLFFENDIVSANNNCRSRTSKIDDVDGKRHISQNRKDARGYTYPSNAVVLRIHRWEGLLFSDVAGYLQSIGPVPEGQSAVPKSQA